MFISHLLKFAKDACVLNVIVALFFVSPAFAYIDPGSGSVIVTTILGLFAAIGYTFRKYFYKLRRKLFGTTHNQDNDDR